jgi:hypothetical protein
MEFFAFAKDVTVGHEAEPLRRGAPKDDNLLPKDQILGFK